MSDETPTYRAIMYMKSGNIISLHNLESFTVHKNSLGQLKQFEWIISPNTTDPYKVHYVDVDQVEAILTEEEGE